MRSIQISADVFQAIWAARNPGEDEEDAILRRLLNIQQSDAGAGSANGEGKPWIDRQYGVSFPHGFEMFRRRKGREYRARVVDGKWQINGQAVSANSINQVSNAVGAVGENGWVGWKYLSLSGEGKKISDLRDPDQIIRRDPSKFSKELINSLEVNI